MKNNRGFTLTELLIVIAVLAILAAVAAPGMSGFVRKNRVQNQTRRIYSDLMNTRVMAMNTNRTHFMVFGLPNNEYQVIEDTDGDMTPDAAPADTVRLARQAVVPFTWSNTTVQNEVITQTFTNNRAVFDGRGFASQTGNICIFAPDLRPTENCIVVTPTRIRIGKYTDGATAAGGCSAANCN